MTEPGENLPWEVLLREQLLLLATLVVGVAYSAGINPPGGVWQENGFGHKAGDSILQTAYRYRYTVFYSFNSMALAALVVVVFLLLLKKPRRGCQIVVLRVVMWLGLLCLMGAYVAGSNRSVPSAVYPATLASFILTYIGFQGFLSFLFSECPLEEESRHGTEEEQRRKVLMLLASFTAVITYFAGLSSSGGYWDRADAFAPLDRKAKARFDGFFYCNATAFMASIFVIQRLLSKNTFLHTVPTAFSYMLVLLPLLCLLGAYAAGTYRNTDTNVYVLCLIAGFLANISLVIVLNVTARWHRQSSTEATTSTVERGEQQEETVGSDVIQLGSSTEEEYRKVKFLTMLLATLTATVTYQAGLHPPGGFWPDDGGDRHIAGHPTLLSTNSWRYRAFLYFNSGAFVMSLAAILGVMVQKENTDTTLLAFVIADVLTLMAAYTAAGDSFDANSYIYTGAMICCLIIHVVYVRRRTRGMEYAGPLKKRCKRLLLIAIMVAIITYQAVMNPPGGFRHLGDAAGDVLLLENYPRQLGAFFFCNTVSFMTTIAVSFFFGSPKIYRRAPRCYTLYGCIVVALLGIMAANAAGVTKRVQIRAYVFVLLAIVVSVIVVRTIRSRLFLLEKEEEDVEGSLIDGPAPMPRPRPRLRSADRRRQTIRSVQETMFLEVYASHEQLMLLGILVAGATYQAGLNPPGGLWQDDNNPGRAGNPVLYDSSRRRYLVFYYCNTTCFVSSVFLVALQLQQIIWKHQPNNTRRLRLVTRSALVLDLLGLLAAYAASTTWELGNAIVLGIMLMSCIAIHLVLYVRIMHTWAHAAPRASDLQTP